VPILKYTRLFHVQIPDYYINRIAGGKQKLIARVKGHSQVSEHSYSLDPNTGWSDLLTMAYNYWQGFDTELPENQVMWMELHADIRNPGESLAYKIVVGNSDYKLKNCGHKDQSVLTLTVDADGDGRMDFIPDYEYTKNFGKYYSWLVPAIALN
jgi:hypothetical protein